MFVTEKRFETGIRGIDKRFMMINERLNDNCFNLSTVPVQIEIHGEEIKSLFECFRALCDYLGLELTYEESQPGKWVVKKKKKGK